MVNLFLKIIVNLYVSLMVILQTIMSIYSFTSDYINKKKKMKMTLEL